MTAQRRLPPRRMSRGTNSPTIVPVSSVASMIDRQKPWRVMHPGVVARVCDGSVSRAIASSRIAPTPSRVEEAAVALLRVRVSSSSSWGLRSKQSVNDFQPQPVDRAGAVFVRRHGGTAFEGGRPRSCGSPRCRRCARSGRACPFVAGSSSRAPGESLVRSEARFSRELQTRARAGWSVAPAGPSSNASRSWAVARIAPAAGM